MNGLLVFNDKTPRGKLLDKTGLVKRFQQTRAKSLMNTECGINNFFPDPVFLPIKLRHAIFCR